MVIPGNAQHIGRRAAQEDAFAFSDLEALDFLAHGGAMCVVCDGMGGHAAGAAASDAAVKAFLAAYQAKPAAETIGAALLRAVSAANEAVAAVADREGDSGSTLAAIVVHDARLFWVSVGDSRIWLRRDERLFRVNREHHYRAELRRRAARGELTRADAESDPRGEQLTSSLGERPLGAVDHCLRGYPLQPGDAVFVASDGLYKALDDAALTELAAATAAGTPTEICAAWLAATLARAAPDQDNVTVAGLQWPAARDADQGAVVAADDARLGERSKTDARTGLEADDAHGIHRGLNGDDDHPRRGPPPDRRAWRMVAMLAAALALIGVLAAAWDHCCRGPAASDESRGDDLRGDERAAPNGGPGNVIDAPGRGAAASSGTPSSGVASPPAAPGAAAGAAGATGATGAAGAAGAAGAELPPDADRQRRLSVGATQADRRQGRAQP
ncbi:MAG: PP2C family serine/threonine-protein phosphatase [Burkholderiaceae bacterium]